MNHRSITRATTAAAALAVASALALSTAGVAAAAPLAAEKAAKGTMGWGVKESFRGYVEGPIADGGIEVTAPAKRKADGTFTWARGKGKVDVGADTANVKLKGSVYFYGHDEGSGPQLEITIDKPRIVIDGADSVLVADVTSRGFGGGDPIVFDDVELVTIDASDLDLTANGRGIVSANGLATELTAAGSEAFAGFYTEGTAFDDLSFKVKIAS